MGSEIREDAESSAAALFTDNTQQDIITVKQIRILKTRLLFLNRAFKML